MDDILEQLEDLFGWAKPPDDPKDPFSEFKRKMRELNEQIQKK